MNTKANALLVVVALLVSVGCWVGIQFSYSKVAETVMHGSMLLAQLSGLYLLVRSGTLIKSLYWITLCVVLVLFGIGVLFKLQHWPGAGAILFLSVTGIASVYVVSFVFKKNKNGLDVLKTLWVLSYTSHYLSRLYHLVNYEQASFWQSLNILLFWFLLAYFGLLQYKHGKRIAV